MGPLVDRGFVRLDEGLMHYRVAGEGLPLVMLHASPSSSATLEGLGAALAQASGRRVIMPDTPGNGLSVALPGEAPELVDYAAMIERFCDGLGLGAVDVYGTHTGAHIGIEWALAPGSRVRRLVLDGVAVMSAVERDEYLAHYAPPREPDAHGTQFPWAFNMIRDQMIFWPHYRQDGAHFRSGGRFEPALLHALTMDLLMALPSYHQAYGAVFRHDVLARLEMVMQPMLWLRHAEAPLEAGAEAALARLPRAQVAQTDDMAARVAAISSFLGEG
ncbi:MAG: alpha/beta fold hydrolase [Polymorphobacter sp.]|uniref:alpha/beta fold hydrolase n=1 Tax=Polymorphobacter sp. TaxID=1909290 RepID=UPI003A844A4F